MALTEKYQSLIDLAKGMGADNLVVQDQGNVLHFEGTVSSEADKQKLWDEYGRLDPDMRSGDLVMNIQVSGGNAGTYTVKSGDSLSKIAARHEGVTWQQIWEANRDQISDPDVIHPGQVLKIPTGNN
jgi:nucleoid-associated protein YgaU